MKLSDLINNEPTEDEARTWKSHLINLGPLEDGQVNISKNRQNALIANIEGRLVDIGMDRGDVNVYWTSSRQATAFPTAGIRVIVADRNSEFFRGTEQADLLPTAVKAIIKNGFRQVLGFDVKADREHIVAEYSNAVRFLDFRVDWA